MDTGSREMRTAGGEAPVSRARDGEQGVGGVEVFGVRSRRRDARTHAVRPSKRRAALWASPIDGAHEVSVTPANADGVAVEWVEAVPASRGQPTIVLFHGCRPLGQPLEAVRPLATRLAMVTAARVLSVACGRTADGVTAYAWLLGEGLDLETTRFVGGPADSGLAAAVRLAANELGLRTPADAWTFAWGRVAVTAPVLRLGGGTDEIQRNILAERVLGLPRVPR